MRKQIPKPMPEWYWLVCIALLFAALALILTGCTRGPSVRQQPTATVEAAGDVVVEQPTISEIARDLTAKIESVGGDMTQVGHKLDEQRRLLEEQRTKYQLAMFIILVTMLGGGWVIALASRSNFAEAHGFWVKTAGVAVMLSGPIYAVILIT